MYQEVKALVMERLGEITEIDEVLGYEPQTIQVPRLIYVLLESYTNNQLSGFAVRVYRLRARLCFRWQDNEGAELELDAYVDSVPDAIGADPQFGGRLLRGVADVPEATTSYIEFAGIIYRVLEVIVEVTTKD